MQWMLPTFVILAGTLAAADFPKGRPISLPKGDLTLTDAIQKIKEQSGNTIDISSLDGLKTISGAFDKVDFWRSVETIASQTESHLEIVGGKIALKPGPSTAPSFIHGPFRFQAREVIVQSRLTSGTVSYEVLIEVAWEPWLNAYRIDTTPQITSGIDDQGKKLRFPSAGARSPVSWNTAELRVRPQGLTRQAKSLSLAGSIQLTMAEELMSFQFDPHTGKPLDNQKEQKGVSVAIVRSTAEGNDWIVEMEMDYGKSEVAWESFEDYWLRGNILRLIPPKGEPIQFELENIDRQLRYVAKNRAKQVGKDWKLDYRTPGPMREVKIPFDLKQIPLP
jgi:hypothetical protein